MSPSCISRNRSMRSTTNARSIGSMASTWRGVSFLIASLRSAVCSGGSIITMGASIPSFSFSP
jgi:hypothetical protein